MFAPQSAKTVRIDGIGLNCKMLRHFFGEGLDL
jgi:hypothetical protein